MRRPVYDLCDEEARRAVLYHDLVFTSQIALIQNRSFRREGGLSKDRIKEHSLKIASIHRPLAQAEPMKLNEGVAEGLGLKAACF